MNEFANRIREVFLNGTWISGTNYKYQLTRVDWQQATQRVGSFNTMAALTFHIHYYLGGVLSVLKGGSLDIQDKYSFDMPPVVSQEDWEKRLEKLWSDAEELAALVERLSEKKLQEVFVKEQYGTYQRNLDAMIEHGYYHLGQLVLIRKMLDAGKF
jgi:uncharacterized damage-inducible protein DinB